MAVKYKMTNKGNVVCINGELRTLIVDINYKPVAIDKNEVIIPKTIISNPFNKNITIPDNLLFFINKYNLDYEHEITSTYNNISNFYVNYPDWENYFLEIINNKTYQLFPILKWLILNYKINIISDVNNVVDYIIENKNILNTDECIELDVSSIINWCATIKPLSFLSEEFNHITIMISMENHLKQGGSIDDFKYYIENSSDIHSMIIDFCIDNNILIDVLYKKEIYYKKLITSGFFINEYIEQSKTNKQLLSTLTIFLQDNPKISLLFPNDISCFLDNNQPTKENRLYYRILEYILIGKYNSNNILYKLFIENKETLNENTINIVYENLRYIDDIGYLLIFKNIVNNNQNISNKHTILSSVQDRIKKLSI